MIEYTDNIGVDVDQLHKWNKFNVIIGTAPLFSFTYACNMFRCINA